MKIKAYARFRKSYVHLPSSVQRKVDKQVALLAENMRHPSLHIKRIQGTEGL